MSSAALTHAASLLSNQTRRNVCEAIHVLICLLLRVLTTRISMVIAPDIFDVIDDIRH